MYFWFMVNLDHMIRKRHPHTSFWRRLPGSAGGTGCPLAPSAIGPYSYEKVLVDGGFITVANMHYHFFVTDHLGNVRVVVNDAGVVEQVNQFYPYGESTDMGQGVLDSVGNPYKWTGKEWDEDQGAYDFGARMYSAADARWTTMDPLSEKYYHISPYAGSNYNLPQKTGIYIHRTNWDGFAGDNVSVGCLLLTPANWTTFKTKVEGHESIKVQVIRSDCWQLRLNCFFDNTITANFIRR